MKYDRFIYESAWRTGVSVSLSVSILCVLASSAVAQQVADDVRAVTAPKARVLTLDDRATMTLVPYVGVMTSAADPAQREQAKLPGGVGIEVNDIDPHSPAADAGLLPDDIVQKFNDQIIVNPQQFAVLVRLHKPQDRVTLAVVRAGVMMDVPLTLGEKLMPPIEDAWTQVPNEDAQAAPSTKLKGLARRFQSTISHSDAQHVLSIITRDGQRSVVIKSRNGEVVYQGALNTPQDLSNVPDGLREKVDRALSNSDRIRSTTSATQPTVVPNPPGQ